MKKTGFLFKFNNCIGFLPFAFCLLSLSAFAQVRLKISALGDGETFLVSALPERSFIGNESTTGSVQISVRVPSSAHFTAGQITSLQQDVKWIDNVYLEKPDGDKSHNYVSFALVSTGTKGLTYQQSQELPLFTFKNIGTGCSGKIELVDNADTSSQKVVANGFNVGNHITILGYKGESFAGLVNASYSVSCSASLTGVNTPNDIAMSVFPVPAKVEVNAQWQTSVPVTKGLISVINPKGEIVYAQKVADSQTSQTVDVQSFPTGIYMLRLESNGTALVNKSFVVSH